MKQNMKTLMLFVVWVLVLNLCACSSSGTAEGDGLSETGFTWQDYYDLGVRYLSEGNYEEAIVEFLAAIEIDPKRADAYWGLADAYAALEDYETAIDTLHRGAEATGVPELRIRAEEIEQMLSAIVDDEEQEDVLTRINYYDQEGTLLYHEDYLYYPDGKLGYTLMTKVEHYLDGTYDSTQYSKLYLYGREGQLERTVLDGLSISSWFDERTGKVTMGYQYDTRGNLTEISIYPEWESIEQEKFGVDPERTERVFGVPEHFPAVGGSRWARAYLAEVFSGQEYTDETYCCFLYIDNDYIPELMVDYSYGYSHHS